MLFVPLWGILDLWGLYFFELLCPNVAPAGAFFFMGIPIGIRIGIPIEIPIVIHTFPSGNSYGNSLLI